MLFQNRISQAWVKTRLYEILLIIKINTVLYVNVYCVI